MANQISIRRVASHEDLHAAVRVQQRVWGWSDWDTVPHGIFRIADSMGGLILGAFDGAEMIGFSLAFPAIHRGVPRGHELYFFSHMTAVLPEYQNQHVGRRLKLRQRQEALEEGIEVIEWTFDPLEIRNAYFNIERLGVIVRGYLPNHYDITSSSLHGDLPTDRVLADWRLASPRVRAIAERGERITKQVEASIHIPAAVGSSLKRESAPAREVQTRIRGEFSKAFSDGLMVVGYQRSEAGGDFLLGRLEDQPVSAANAGGEAS